MRGGGGGGGGGGGSYSNFFALTDTFALTRKRRKCYESLMWPGFEKVINIHFSSSVTYRYSAHTPCL